MCADQKCCCFPMLCCCPGASAGERRPLWGGALLSPCPRLWASTTVFSLGSLWTGGGTWGRWLVLLQSYEGLGGLEALTWWQEVERAGGAVKPPSPWHQSSLPGDGCPFSMLVAHGWVVARSWSLWPPPKSCLWPTEYRGAGPFLMGGSRTSRALGLTDRGVLGETCFSKGIFVQSNCSFGLLQSPLGGRFIVYIDSCTISQPSPPPLPTLSPAVL